jgi:hypothetical protein
MWAFLRQILIKNVYVSSNGTIRLKALWPPASSLESDSLLAWLAAAAFAGLSLGHDQPKKKPWCSNPGLCGW